MNTYEQHIRDTVYGTLLKLNFLDESVFSIEDIRNILGLNNNIVLTEDAQKDIDTELYAQNIVLELMKEYNKRIHDALISNKPLNLIFDIEGIKFGFQQSDKKRYSSLPEKQEVFILDDLLNIWNSNNIKAIKHEVIHCLDVRRVKDKKAISNSNGKIGSEYYTAPLEYNAFSHELFQEVLERMIDYCNKKGINPREYFSDEKILANFISNTLTLISDDPNDIYHTFLSSLSEDKQRRFFNRIYGIAKKTFIEHVQDITIACNEGYKNIFMENLIESILTKGK